MITIYHKTIKDSAPKVLKEFKIGSWVCLEKPTEEELAKIATERKLELDLLKDALDPYEVPRLEQAGEVVYIFTRVPHQDNTRLSTVPILVALGPDFILTVSQESVPFLRKFIDGQREFTTTQKTKFFFQIFSEINAAYTQLLTTISRRVRSSSVQLEAISNRAIMQLVSFENILNDFLAALVPTNAILNKLLSGKIITLYENDRDLVEDLELANDQLTELAKGNLKTIVNIREAYSTIVSNNLNQVVKLLTSLTIILTVPMIISSFYGMNVALPMAESPLAFWIILGTTITITTILIITFIRNRWL